jgi:hypothetical protein
VSISDIDAAALLRSIAAGDGGSGASKGGAGGSLTDIRVADHDIGVRSGVAYGYTTMGGLFAGLGGGGTTSGKNGSVSKISARAIASIVAGKSNLPQLVEKVSYVYVGNTTGTFATDLTENTDLDLAEVAGDANYYAVLPNPLLTANFVGSFSNPTAVDGNKFQFIDTNSNGFFDIGEQPIDGLVAAKVFDQKTMNFTPEFFRGEGSFLAGKTVVGDGSTQEVQNVQVVGATSFVLVYGSSETAKLSGTASALTVQNALNKLPSITAAGGVTVTSFLGIYSVIFNDVGARTDISSSIIFDFNNQY